jgi:hypothetical protein
MLVASHKREHVAYLFLTEIVGQVGNHNLCGGWDSIFGRSALLLWTRSTRLLFLGFRRGGLIGFVGNVGQWKNIVSFAILAIFASLINS